MTATHFSDEKLLSYATGQASPEERVAIEAHLATCSCCRDSLAQWQSIGASLAAKKARIPADTHAKSAWEVLARQIQTGEPMSTQESRQNPLMARERLDGQASPSRLHRPAAEGREFPHLPSHPSRPITTVSATLVFILTVVIVGSYALLRHRLPGRAAIPTTVTSPTPLPTITLGQWTLLPQPTRQTGLPKGALLSDIVMTSPDEGWAVGYIRTIDTTKLDIHDQLIEQVSSGLLLHYSRGKWSVSPDNQPSFVGYTFEMISPTDIWALGSTVGQANSGELSSAMHFQGGHWALTALPAPIPSLLASGAVINVNDVWILAEDDVWVADDRNMPSSQSLWHFDGRSTQRVSLPAKQSVTHAYSSGARGDDWLVGGINLGLHAQGALILHAQGDQVTAALQTSSNSDQLFQLFVNPQAGSASHDIWATGTQDFAGSSGSTPLLYHYDGTKWSPVELQSPATVRSMTLTGPNEGFGIAQPARTGTPGPGMPRLAPSYQYKDGVWSPVAWPNGLDGSANPSSVTGGDSWAIASFNSMIAQPPQGGVYVFTQSVLVRFVNGQWVQYTGQ